MAAGTCHQIRCGLKFFYDLTLRRPRAALSIPVVRIPQKLPEMLHVVPTGFMRIRHYGLLANCTRTHKLTRCRALLRVRAVPTELAAPTHDAAHGAIGHRRSQCPQCGGRMRVVELLAPHLLDTS